MKPTLEIEVRCSTRRFTKMAVAVSKIVSFGPENRRWSWLSLGSDDDTFLVLEPYESLKARIEECLQP